MIPRSAGVDEDRPDPLREVRSQTSFGPWELMSLATARWKAIEAIDAPRGQHGVAVYDLEADPRERRNVATQRSALAGYARQSLEAARREGAARAGEVPVIDRETAARLRALGYAD